jgi:C-terminal processing protease CtpA/Prc
LISRKGEYFVAAVATQNGKPTIEGVQVGDKLLKVGELPLSGATRGAILSAMHGKPGEVRVLTLERNDKTFTVEASIKSF